LVADDQLMHRNPIWRLEPRHFNSAFVVGFFALIACSVSAQSPSPTVVPESSSETEPVIVTGSYIPTQTAAEVGPNPVQIIDRGEIERSGYRNTEELLRSQPVANAHGVPTSGNAGITSGQAGASIALRGLDPGATLVLINGHRIAPHPSGTNFGFETFFDLNTIPRAAIENIEILKDGASTTYGADAIAGVVNFKLRRDYRGAEVNIDYGNTTDKDSGEVAASLVFGEGDEKTSFTGVLNYYSRNSIYSHDRAYDRDTPSTRASTNASPFNLEVSRSAAEAAAGRPITEVDPSLDTFFAHAPFGTNGTEPASEYVYTEDRSVHFPLFRYLTELPDAERYGGYVNAEHKIFGDQMVAFGDLSFQQAEVHYQLPPDPTFNFQNSGQSVSVTPLAIPPPSPGLIVGGPSYADVGLPADAYNPFNPFSQIISGDSRGRLFELGQRNSDTTTYSFFTTVGLHGDKLFGGDWGYDTTFRYSQLENDFTLRTVSASRFQRTLNAADPIFDPSSPQFIGTTIPYNPFADYRVPVANNYQLAPFTEIHPGEVDRSSLATVDVNIYTTKLFRLLAGPVGFAFGAQFRRETLDQNPDSVLQSGDALGEGVYAPVSGSGETYAAYAETIIPVFGGDYFVTGFHAFDFTAAGRFEGFGNDTNVLVPKLGMRWQPVDDSLTIRATWGEGFRQPTLAELFSPLIYGTSDVFDPKKGAFITELPTTFLPNPDLQPEDSHDFTAGIVYSPKFVSGLTVSIDFFNIETMGWVNPNPSPTVAIERIESGQGLPGESTTRDAAGNLTQLTYISFSNTGAQKVRGADFGLTYEMPTSYGIFRSMTQVTYLDSYQVSNLPGGTEHQLIGQPLGPLSDDAYLKWKGLSQLDWTWRGLNAAVTAHYFNGFHELDANYNHHWVGQTWLFDLQASYAFGSNSWQPQTSRPGRFHKGWPTWRTLLNGAKLTVGCNNVFDHDPPKSNDNFPRFIYDSTGRFVYASVTEKFW